MNVLNLPVLNNQPPSVELKTRSKPTKEWNNRIKTINVSPTSNGGTIQLQSQYGVNTYNTEEDSERKRETVPPFSFSPVPQYTDKYPVIQQTESPYYYKPYNPNLDDIYPLTSPTYIPPPTPRTAHRNPSISGYTRTAGET